MSDAEMRGKCRRPFGFGRRSAVFIVTPPPRCASETTASYIPVPHNLLVNQVEDLLPGFGLTLSQESFELTREGNQLFGVLSCRNGHSDVDYTMAIGLRNSYDRSLPVGLVAGVQVLVCSNLCFSGEVSMKRRHTRNVLKDLPGCIEEMLGSLKGLQVQQSREIDHLRDTSLTSPHAHDLMVQVVRSGVFPASKLPKVIQEWDEPRHEEFLPRTAWSLLNAFTEVQKERSPSARMDVGLMKVFREVLQ